MQKQKHKQKQNTKQKQKTKQQQQQQQTNLSENRIFEPVFQFLSTAASKPIHSCLNVIV